MKYVIKYILLIVIPLLSFTAEKTFAVDNIVQPQTMSIYSANLYPEGIAWSGKRDALFISSVREGEVKMYSPERGLSTFIKDDRFISTVGLLVDDSRNALWVTNSDSGLSKKTSSVTQGKMTGVARYDLQTGKQVAWYDLGKLSPGKHLANDLTVDHQGNVFVTDSFSPIIWKISKDGQASVYLSDPRFNVGAGYNLNGIVTLKNGDLLVGNSLSGKIFKVSLRDPHHAKAEEVRLSTGLKSLDGLRMSENGNLFVVVNDGQKEGYGEIVQLKSTDDWGSAEIVNRVASLDSMPTTATVINGKVWVLNAQLDKLIRSPANPPLINRYLLQRVN